jgi:hypothetical protein
LSTSSSAPSKIISSSPWSWACLRSLVFTTRSSAPES